LLNRLSTMYYVVRQQLDESSDQAIPPTDAQSQTQNGEKHMVYKC